MSPLRLTIEDGLFRDSHGRQITLRGINVAGDAKYPSNPDQPSHIPEDFFDGDNVNFHTRPFPREDAHIHFSRLKRWGYNTIRYVFTWEAIEPSRPGVYDEEWIQHTIEILRLAKDYGFYIFMDPHQDVWSRFSGGSGAPMWTLYACGLNPQSFAATEAALVHNTYPDPATFPKMIWSTNYTRLACQTIFTFFFAGRDFAPKCIIDGKNIQDYLRDHYLDACSHLAKRIHEAGDLEDDVVIGWESMNEPNRGLVGWSDLSTIPTEQKLQKGTSPTAWQAMLTGSGRVCEIDTWDFGGMGPYKSGRVLVDPQGESAWLPADYDDSRYGYKRDPGWKLGECVWAQHGVWDPSTDTLLKKNYFKKNPRGEVLDYEQFTNIYFMEFYRKFRDTIRAQHKDCILFCQPPVLEIPPSIKGTADDDPKMVYAPHYYDGLTLMTKKWNRYWNVDVLGVLRGRYMSPAFAVKIGETAIRNCFKDQLSAIVQEGLDYMGNHPTILTEFGIPYDMDDKYAYKTGDYSSQSGAMDANHYAIEGSSMAGYTLWLYMTENKHHLGDQWNGEDLSIFSVDDRLLPLSPVPPTPSNDSTTTLEGPSTKIGFSNESTVNPRNLKAKLKTPSISSEATDKPPELTSAPGFRAAEAYVRPSPISTVGKILNHGFDLRNCIFTLRLHAHKASAEDHPTEIFLPEFHFPKDQCEVEVTGGKWTISTDDSDGGFIQTLRWWHMDGEHSIRVKGVQRQNMRLGKEEEEGYLDQCQQTKCSVM
ncbi:putative glycosyl hydrolase [Lachnellula hyalina]|uniref:Putative glycosyl hydrolase n=1 Tax=Lachnellula hyalina TaxID=1316788 RepID=A0A8H8QWE0_9HELO|nr:putative glycosyl hydrolase [Lachnellula hyalina]TVY23761.1 putative glycosyl hydrolase [Lachnellula hyalina]